MGFFKSLWNGVKSVAGAIGGPLVSGGLNLVGSLIGSNSQRNAQNSANRANMQLAEYQYSKDLEMWNRQNEYNSPQAQMQRYREAGLNPNLIYGQGSSGNASSAPSYNAPSIASNGGIDYGQAIGSAIQSYQNVAMNLAQLNLMSKQGAKLGSDASYANVRSWQAIQNVLMAKDKWKIQRPFMTEYWRLKNNNLQQDANNKVIQATYMQELSDYTRQKYKNLQIEYSMLRDKSSVYAKMLDQQLKTMKQQFDNLTYQGDRLVNENSYFRRNGYYPGTGSSPFGMYSGFIDWIKRHY